MSDVSARVAAAQGDPSALLALVFDLATENARLVGEAVALKQARAELEEAERERKRVAADKKYRQRHGLSRDVPGQDGTSCDVPVPPSPPAGKEKGFIGSPPSPVTPTGVSRPAPRPRAGRTRAEPPSWVAEGVALWESIVGAVPHGEFGAALKPMTDRHGWPAVKPDLEKWLRDRAAAGKPARPAWYAGECTARLAPKPPIRNDDGTLTEYGERITRPDPVPA